MKIGLISFRLLLFFLPFSISFCFCWFHFHFVDFISISFRFVSFSLISFRFYFVSHFIGAPLVWLRTFFAKSKSKRFKSHLLLEMTDNASVTQTLNMLFKDIHISIK